MLIYIVCWHHFYTMYGSYRRAVLLLTGRHPATVQQLDWIIITTCQKQYYTCTIHTRIHTQATPKAPNRDTNIQHCSWEGPRDPIGTSSQYVMACLPLASLAHGPQYIVQKPCNDRMRALQCPTLAELEAIQRALRLATTSLSAAMTAPSLRTQ